MGDLLIRNISDAMKRGLAARAEETGRSLSDEAKVLLQKAMADGAGGDVPVRSGWDVFSEIFSPLSAEDREEFSRIMEEVEIERKKDFGRPVEDLE